jgi:serine/threonine protein kinase
LTLLWSAANLLIGVGGELKIADFGLARKLPAGDLEVKVKKRVGTLLFNAPEVCYCSVVTVLMLIMFAFA